MNPESHLRNLKMTRFICQELLYEFATGRLDLERQRAMDAYLTSCRESQRELDKLKRGLLFTAIGQRAELARELREGLLSFEPQWKKILSAWTMKFAQHGWRLLPYAVLVLAIGTGLAVFRPWKHKDNRDITLIEQLRMEPDSAPPPVKVNPTNTRAEIAATSTPVISLDAPATKETAPVTVAVAAPPVKRAEEAPAAAPEVHKTSASATSGQGALTRGELEVTDFANSSAAIRQKIIALGGKVAGNVELGWLKRKDESYFHFSLPESNRAELELFLKTFGPVRFRVEPHPRVMPEGQIRIILTVKDGSTNDGREEAETP